MSQQTLFKDLNYKYSLIFLAENLNIFNSLFIKNNTNTKYIYIYIYIWNIYLKSRRAVSLIIYIYIYI